MRPFRPLLPVIAAILSLASSVCATNYNVNVDTSSLSKSDGYLYLQYVKTGVGSPLDSTAIISQFATDGSLGIPSDPYPYLALDPTSTPSVTGTLPGNVMINNTNAVNDYLQAITFGNSFSFNFVLANAANGVADSTSSFSLWLSRNADGSWPEGTDSMLSWAFVPLFIADLFTDGTTVIHDISNPETVTVTDPPPSPVPEPGTLLMVGAGLMLGIVAVRRKTILTRITPFS